MEINKFLRHLLLASWIIIAPITGTSQNEDANMSSTEFQTIAEETIRFFQETLNIIQDSFSESDQIKGLIRDTYTNNRDQLFYDSTALIANDLQPGAVEFKAMPVWEYLKQFNKIYQKNDDNTVDFFNVFVGPAEIHKDTVVVTVFYDSKFNGKNKGNKLPHLKVAKKAQVIFYKSDDSWEPYIHSIDALPPNFEFSDDYLTNFFSDKLGIVGDLMERVYNNRVIVNYGNFAQTYYSDSSLIQHGEVGEWYIPSKNTLRIQFKNDNVLLASDNLKLNLKGKSLEDFSYSKNILHAGSPFFTLNTSGNSYNLTFPENYSLIADARANRTFLDYNSEKTVEITNDNAHLKYSLDIPFYINSETEKVSVGRSDEKTEITTLPDRVESSINGFKRIFYIDNLHLIADMILVQNNNLKNDNPPGLKNFYIDKHEVTIAQFKAFVDSTGYVTDAEKNGFSYIIANPSNWARPKKLEEESPAIETIYALQKRNEINWRHDIYGNILNESGYKDYPVVHVSYNDAQKFAEWKEKRLPTESEWRYAQMGGIYQGEKKSKISDISQYDKTAGEKLQKTGKLPGNELNVFDMTGNVFEWIESADDSEKTFAIGGCFLSNKKEVESIIKFDTGKNISYCISGFRCVLDIHE